MTQQHPRPGRQARSKDMLEDEDGCEEVRFASAVEDLFLVYLSDRSATMRRVVSRKQELRMVRFL